MKIAILKYNAGNTQSVRFALTRLGHDGIVTDDPEKLREADKIIFPGVGEASSAMRYLRERKLDETIKDLKQPVLGICLGMQLLCRFSEENDTECLGVFDTDVKKFQVGLKVPHVGWNQEYYYVHSYYAELCPQTIAVTEYGVRFSSILQKNNFLGVQFHPEKSGKAGEQILKIFLGI